MVWDTLSYCLFRAAGALAPRVPAPVGYRLAERLGTIIYRLSPLRSCVEENISQVLGQPARSPEVRGVVRQVYRNQAKNYFDLLRVASLDEDDIRSAVREVVGIEHLDAALARGRGVVLTSAHFGNIDLAGQILALHGYRVVGIAEHLRPERLFHYVRRARESHGLAFIPIDGWLRPVFRALRENAIVGSALDRNVTDSGRIVEFLGRPAQVPDGYARLALRTGAALLVAFSRRLPDNTFIVTVEPEIRVEQTGDPERDTASAVLQVLAVFAGHVRRYPEQWVYFQPLWLPDGGAASVVGSGAPQKEYLS
ncbi:MAG: lysophospholipid acyltransferase family protein [Anaerolineae bacterium]|nr:lysophospholipid acyltransferase family protein [Anaerolineae bacterium]